VAGWQGGVATAADDKESRTTPVSGGVAGAFSSADCSPYHRAPAPAAAAARPGTRPSVGSWAGGSGGGVLLPRPDSSSAATPFNAVFHGVDPDVASTPPPPPPPADDAANGAEKLGFLQFKLAYDFQVRTTAPHAHCAALYGAVPLSFCLYLYTALFHRKML